MDRKALGDLEEWRLRERRKPLILRGARQVGKTTLVRLFAKRSFGGRLAELNFERAPGLAELFEPKDPERTVKLLELHLDQEIIPGETLLFLDEIQAAPEVLAALRYFFEELPELHVIAAGSLLELVLECPAFPVPVGRIEYLYLGPMTFSEFLRAAGGGRLADFLAGLTLDAIRGGDSIPSAIHEQLLDRLKIYLLVGGMPDAVRAFLEGDSFLDAEAVKQSILATFREDFGKYGPKVDTVRLRKVFERLPALVGEKLKYVHIDREERSKDLAEALHLLTLARVAFRVPHTSANGVPLGAETDERKAKVLNLDVGLMATATGLSVVDLETADELVMVHRGALAEQFIGQHLLYSGPSWEPPRLHYWVREKKGSAAEVDYVISHGTQIVPVEVKAGKTGTLKSLHVFLREKKRHFGLRFSSAPPSLLETKTTVPRGRNVPFTLFSLPLYLVGETRRLVGEALAARGPGRESPAFNPRDLA